MSHPHNGPPGQQTNRPAEGEPTTVLDAVRSHLQQFQVSASIINNVGSTVRLAVNDLQNHNVLDPITIRDKVVEFKDEHRIDDEMRYNYFRLPKDFRQLEIFELESRPMYKYVVYDEFLRRLKPQRRARKRSRQTVLRGVLINTADRLRDKDMQHTYTIVTERYENGVKENQLIPNPFPDDDDLELHIKYHPNGIETPIEAVPEEYYLVVIQKVMELLGMGDPRQTSEQIRKTRDIRNPNRQGQANDSFATTSPSFFGNHRRNIRWNK